ncbi:MAG: MFS transporter [Holosporales bacterium]|jgi:PAT family beta-lactamase induction signal transducer AmpG|nr:MFS transporter [Holosporales bacterium]
MPGKLFCQFAMVIFGASGGLSFFSLTLLLFYRMSYEGIDQHTIRWFALAAIPYNIRFLLPYLIDSVKIPYWSNAIGQRKSWGYLTHSLGMLCFFVLGCIDPTQNLPFLFAFVLVSALLAAMQDIVSDAYRFSMVDVLSITESVPLHTIGFRSGKLLVASVIPILASSVGWAVAHGCVLGIKLIALALLFFLPEPKYTASRKNESSSTSVYNALVAIIDALKDALKRPGVWVFLGVFLLTKAIDVVLGPLETVFMGQIKVSSSQYGWFKGGMGGIVSFIGVWIAGPLARKLSINTALKVACLGLSSSGVLSLILAHIPTTAASFKYVLTSIAAIQEFHLGVVLTLAVIYVSSFCNKSDSIYDFTLFSSIGSMGRTLLTFFLSEICYVIGWVPIFFLPLLLCIPLFWLLGRDFSSKQRLN